MSKFDFSDFIDKLFVFGYFGNEHRNDWWLEKDAGAKKCPVWVYGRL